MNVNELINKFHTLTKEVNWDEVRREQGVKVDMNLTRNLLIRYLDRNGVEAADIAPAVGLDYLKHRQVIYDTRSSDYSAYRRIEKELGLV